MKLSRSIGIAAGACVVLVMSGPQASLQGQQPSQDGQIRFTIEGQEPFVATKGFLVQVPKRLVYSMETVGDRPSLRFAGTEMATRLAVVGYAFSHVFPGTGGADSALPTAKAPVTR
jgi:hypothetical protein